jgi:hypothetical protein
MRLHKVLTPGTLRVELVDVLSYHPDIADFVRVAVEEKLERERLQSPSNERTIEL